MGGNCSSIQATEDRNALALQSLRQNPIVATVTMKKGTSKETRIDLIKVTYLEFGGTDKSVPYIIYKKADTLGLNRVSSDVKDFIFASFPLILKNVELFNSTRPSLSGGEGCMRVYYFVPDDPKPETGEKP